MRRPWPALGCSTGGKKTMISNTLNICSFSTLETKFHTHKNNIKYYCYLCPWMTKRKEKKILDWRGAEISVVQYDIISL